MHFHIILEAKSSGYPLLERFGFYWNHFYAGEIKMVSNNFERVNVTDDVIIEMWGVTFK